MRKQEFLAQLRKELSGLPQDDVEERLTFYSEMIEDQMEEGFSEEEAVSAVGSVNENVAQVVADIPLTKITKERIRPKRRLSAVEIILLALGSPIWLSLGIASFAVILSLYVSLWAVIISLWALVTSLAVCSVGGVLVCGILTVGGNGASGVAMLAAEKFSVERSTGDVKFNRCDATTIYVKTDTGDVTGNLLSSKVFITNTDTGIVDVLQTVDGGKCEIITNTGDIELDI